MLRPPTENPNNQSRMSQQSNKSRIFGNERKYVTTLKPSLVAHQSVPSNQFFSNEPPKGDQQLIQYQSVRPTQDVVKQSRIVDDSQMRGTANNRIHELLKHSTNPANMEGLLALFRLQQPLALALPSQRATVQTQAPRSTLNTQIPAYYSNYYAQLDAEAEKVRERVKEEAKVVSFIIEKYKRVHEGHDRLKRDSEEITEKLLEYHKQHKQKVFKRQAKYTFQLVESKTDELKDFYEEMYNLMELFSVAAHEQGRPATSNVLTLSRPPQEPGDKQILQQLVGESPQQNNDQLVASQVSQAPESSESRGIEMQSHAVKLFSDLQHYAKHIETTLSEQRRLMSQFYNRVQNVSQSNQEFKQLSQSLLQELQGYPEQEAKSFKELNQLYVLNSQYYKLVANEARDFLLQQNSLLGELRDAISAVDRLHYVHSKFGDVAPQVNVYYEVLDQLLLENDLSKVDPASLPHPSTLNEPILVKLSQLHAQFKQSHIASQRHRHFKNVQLKTFKTCSHSIQTQKQAARETHSTQVDLYQFVKETIQVENDAVATIDSVQQTVTALHTKLTRDGIKNMESYFHRLNAITTDIQMRQKKAQGMAKLCQDAHYQSILQRIQSTLSPTMEQLTVCGGQVDSYVSLGDLDALIDFQELSERIHADEPKLVEFMHDFLQRITAQMQTKTDIDVFGSMMIRLQLKMNPTAVKVGDIQALQQRQVNDSVKNQIQVIAGKWAQVESMKKGFDTLTQAIEYFAVDNLKNLAIDFSENDNQTPINQLDELCAENLARMSEECQRTQDVCWTSYRAHDYETLLTTELDGFAWIHNLIRQLTTFQSGLQRLFNKQPAQPPSQIDFKPASGNYFADQHSQQQQQSQEIPRSVAQFQEFHASLIQTPFHDVVARLYALHPQTFRWTRYETLLGQVLMEIQQKFYKNVFLKVGTLGAGLVLTGGVFDNSKADKVNNFFKTLNAGQMLETSVEIITGQAFSKPESIDDLLEFLIVALQVYPRVKSQYDAISQRQPPSRQASQQDLNVDDQARFEDNVQHVYHFMDTFHKGIEQCYQTINSQQEEINIRIQIPNTVALQNAEKLSPIIALLLFFLDGGETLATASLVTYINLQAAWINLLMLSLAEPIPVYDPTLIDKAYQIFSISQNRPFDHQIVKESLELVQMTSLQRTLLSKCRDAAQAAVMPDCKPEDVAEFLGFLKAVQLYFNFDSLGLSMVNAVNLIEKDYIVPLEQQQKITQPKLSYVPQTFVEQLYLRLTSMISVSELIENFIQSRQRDHIIVVGIMLIDVSQLFAEQSKRYRWGAIATSLRDGFYQKEYDDPTQRQVDFARLDDKSFKSTNIQSQLQFVCSQINS